MRAPSVREAVACDVVVRDVRTRVLAERGTVVLAVALREVFPAVGTAQEVLARAEAVQEALVRTAPLQEVLARVLVAREVLVHALDGVGCVPGGRGDK